MDNQENRLHRELAPEVFQIAAELYSQKQQEYTLQELILIGEEAKIPAEFIQQAVDLVQSKKKSRKIQFPKKLKNLKLVLLGVAAVAATLVVGGWGYNQISTNKTSSNSAVNILPVKSDKEQTHTGNVERYLLNKEGLVEGILLSNGKQIKFAAHNGKQLEAEIKPGDTVEVIGKSGTSSSYGQEIDASVITNTKTNKVVAKQPKPKGEKKPKSSNLNTLKVDDSVQHWLVDGKGEIKGAILTSGTQVHLSKPIRQNLKKLAKTGSEIKADGVGKETPHGYVVQVISLKINGELLPNSN
ncbi:MAG: hypothetical protein EA343_04005 [Nodularia sp. (in: Bacteria)]|nr:MAG: hypothetical protein EA343_04005 [Nodularia sp. (in: cyanobacteria)]